MPSRIDPEVIAARREQVARLTRAGMGARQIGPALGVTARTVTRDRVALGIVGPPRPTITDEQWARADALIADGCSLTEVERTIGISRKVLKRHYPNAGWTQDRIAEYRSVIRIAQREGLL